MSWKLVARASRKAVEAALENREATIGWDENIVLAGFEITPDPGSSPGQARPDEWQLDAYCERKPGKAERDAVKALFGKRAPKVVAEKLPDVDWVTLSQQQVEPIRAGRFHVHTPDFPPLNERGIRDFAIAASQAFGTGQHETTAGCLAMLTHMKAQGLVVRNLADIGTGTGLLAFAALALWPRTLATASDIDPVCLDVVLANAATNRIPLGADPGELTMVIADGMDHELLQARRPYDLLIANILAGPLQGLAPDFSNAVLPGGSILLAGLLTTQEAQVRRAYRMAGCRLAARLVRGDWSILWLRKRRDARVRRTRPDPIPEWSKGWL
ncbi:MAG TPA: 50S ribosomal protein L11 methyltransferase [Sphingomonadaceae bacterium]|nr:50S ribosomal protein L11 methyltransferase [Sphingomonadaceae bacterium]